MHACSEKQANNGTWFVPRITNGCPTEEARSGLMAYRWENKLGIVEGRCGSKWHMGWRGRAQLPGQPAIMVYQSRINVVA